MKFLSRKAPALGARIIPTIEKNADIFYSRREKSCLVYNFGAVLLD